MQNNGLMLVFEEYYNFENIVQKKFNLVEQFES